MKKLVLAIAAFALAAVALSQETYSVAISSAASVTKIDLGRLQHNSKVCSRFNLVSTCTQGQACVAAGVSGGASCTSPDALAAGVRIYANSLSGREAFVANELVKAELEVFVRKNAETAMQTLKTYCLAANQTQQDSLCTQSGQSAGCGLCDAFK